MDLLLENGLVYQAGQLQKMDLLIKDGKIAAFGHELGMFLSDIKSLILLENSFHLD